MPLKAILYFICLQAIINCTFSQNPPNAVNAFTEASVQIKNMLEGKRKLSVKDAYYIMESAWGNVYISHDDFNREIQTSAQFIKIWLSENKLDSTDNIALHYGICRFLRDTLYIKSRSNNTNSQPTTKIHIPFNYDYIDFKAQNDYRNTFVTKTFATGTGQCNTLPSVYLILAEALHAKAWLSYAPHHSFIKFPDNNGTIHNYDPSSHMHITDQLYQDYLFISADAERSRIYLDTLGTKQVIASVLIDLAYMYMLKLNFKNTEFAENLISAAMQYFYKQEANIQAWFILSNIYVNKLNVQMRLYGLQDITKAIEIPELKPLYEQYIEIETKIKQLGYRDIPQQQDSLLMEHYKKKEHEQIDKGVDAKQKKELFIKE